MKKIPIYRLSSDYRSRHCRRRSSFAVPPQKSKCLFNRAFPCGCSAPLLSSQRKLSVGCGCHDPCPACSTGSREARPSTQPHASSGFSVPALRGRSPEVWAPVKWRGKDHCTCKSARPLLLSPVQLQPSRAEMANCSIAPSILGAK